MQIPHVTIAHESGRVTLAVHDYELFDYLDDFLTARNLEFEIITDESMPTYTMRFPSSVTPEYISQALASIPAGETERIWKINNR